MPIHKDKPIIPIIHNLINQFFATHIEHIITVYIMMKNMIKIIDFVVGLSFYFYLLFR